ncbi:50S ribosomal protein L25/general stress protein Ctc [Paenisporosarcina antarctica]|uniref:Large ribosomal subunit protein bL25 n=1 Tax=Paenisporosarcina antarctica TaxID=417367 RepID=A0A4P7A2U0_9BACL|nr:50S ribosomal protein L25/general stress protein Ctc [Paenisporosarcina antarctica]QBP42974.1 50S ribosomal protein L25/general stress protein Ctc [Paenisporosarcina antarctica]
MTTTVKTHVREKGQHSNLTKLRNEGFVPAVVYGFKTEATSIAVHEVDLLKTLREVGRNGVMKLDLAGKLVNVVLSDYQMNVLKGNVVHADFLAINMTDELEVSVTVVTTGSSVGESQGGVLNHPNHELTIKVKPSAIPDSIEIDVTDLEIGDILRVGDMREKCEFNILNDDDFALVSVSAPRTDEELETTADEPAVVAEEVSEEDTETKK